MEMEVENREITLGDLIINVEDKEEVFKKRANKIFDAVIEDIKIGKLKELKEKLLDFEKDKEDNYYLKLIIRVMPNEDGLDEWVYNEYINIDRLVRENKLHPKSKLYKLVKKYSNKKKINIKELKGLNVKVITDEKGYAKLLI